MTKAKQFDLNTPVDIEVRVIVHPVYSRDGVLWSSGSVEINGLAACYQDAEAFENWAEPYGVRPKANYRIPFSDLFDYIKESPNASCWVRQNALQYRDSKRSLYESLQNRTAEALMRLVLHPKEK